MRDHLVDMFNFNTDANRRMVAAVRDISDNHEMIKHLSHLANCQYKWMERIIVTPEAAALDWWDPVYPPDDLIFRFKDSAQRWVDYLNKLNDDQLEHVIQYNLGASSIAEAKIKDIALQLIFHSFHHRAQIQMMIREKGGRPGFIDYIGSRITKKGER